ncbi:MAG: hypothetical protein EP329_21225 [Deltaproteobacteria bacterium]|nr:MAG: hypothetical protein EP329_21225 [Deltaproteobacteria bacterium]
MTIPTGFSQLPAEGDTSARRAMRKVRLLALRELLTWPTRGLSPRVARGLAALQGALVPLTKRAPDEALAIVGGPDVLVQILVHADRNRPPEGLLRELVPHVLFQIGRRGLARHLGEAVLWDAPVARLLDPDGATVTFDAPAEGILADPTGVEVRLADGTAHAVTALPLDDPPRLVRIRDDLPARLALVDTNPLNMEEAHPEKSGNALLLDDHPIEAWRAALADALELIKVGLPGYFPELAHTLDRVVPVGYHAERHFSASYRASPGTIYMSLHPSCLTMAEAIVHEVQHGKLNALTWLDPVLENGQTEWTKSPVRPDMRPLFGVLLAVHAFAPVAALHQGIAAAGHPEADTAIYRRRVAEVRKANADALATVQAVGKPTELGRRVMAAITELEAATSGAGEG